jgi:hypothetical protein
MNICKGWDWITLGIGFWSGVAVISLVNIMLMVLQHNQFLYDEYIFVVSILIVVIYLVLRSRTAAP